MASSPQGSPGPPRPAPPHLEAPPQGKRAKRGGVFQAPTLTSFAALACPQPSAAEPTVS